jgi:hypothetical protein
MRVALALALALASAFESCSNGSVRQLEVAGEVVVARVRGSRRGNDCVVAVEVSDGVVAVVEV